MEILQPQTFKRGHRLQGAALALLAAMALGACAGGGSGAWSPGALARLTATMDPAMLAVAQRHLPGRRRDLWDRTPGWETYDLASLPALGFSVSTYEEAQRINALKPSGSEPPAPVRPFILKARADDRAQALRCLTQAVYYEAATEPLAGQQAVAQTVINRLRHAGYPKSVCGVVFEGSMRPTGCQFSFTCDGSLARAPLPGLWKQAQSVAKNALAGFVARDVGTATHYHADYVAPYWAPTLYKITQIGAHIFYRWTGPAGEPQAFTARYQGGEHNLTPAILQGIDERIQGDKLVVAPPGRTVTLGPAGEVRTYTVVDPARPGAPAQTRTAGTLTATRRAPTKEEVAAINARLKALEEATAPVTPAPEAGGFTTGLPVGETPPAKP